MQGGIPWRMLPLTFPLSDHLSLLPRFSDHCLLNAHPVKDSPVKNLGTGSRN